MKTLAKLLLLCFTILFLQACKKENNPCFKKFGKVISEIRSLSQDIELIILKDNVNLFIVQDTFNSIRIETGENMVDFIRTDVKGRALTISDDNKCNFLRSYKKETNVYVHLIDLDSLDYKGSGDISTVGVFNTQKLKFDFHDGTGNLDLNLNCSSFSRFLQHTGSADLKVRGFSKQNIIFTGGTGVFDFSELKTEVTEVNHNGTGDCQVRASHDIFAYIRSVGNTYCYGEANITVWDKTGKGNIYKRN